MDFDRWSVARKLLLGFGTCVALAALIGGSAVWGMASLRNALADIVHVNNPEARAAVAMRIAVNQIALATRDALLSPDAQTREEVAQRIRRARESYDRAEKQIEALFAAEPRTTPEEHKLFDEARKLRDIVRPKRSDLLAALARGEIVAATHQMAELDAPDKAWREKLGELAEFEDKLNAEAADAAMGTFQQSLRWVLGLTAGAALIASLVGWRISRSLLQSLGGEPSDAAAAASRIARGDLRTPVRTRPGAGAESLLVSMETMRRQLGTLVHTIRSSANEIATGSGQISTGNQDLSQRTEEQASNLQQTAASMEQLSGTVKNNADTAREAVQMASAASQVAEQAGQTVDRVVQTMTDISTASKKINDIISVIDSIAFQTNILALNAAVEAARAGEQGRGFAVVAAEVRTLAQRSAGAAKEIKSLINNSGEKVESGTTLVDEAGKTMTEVVHHVRRVSDLISEISAASQEQTLGIEQVGAAVGQLDQVTQQNAALVEESAAAADSLNQQASRLAAAVAIFETES